MLTDIQKANLYKLDWQMQLEIMHECAEGLGIVSVDDYCRVMRIKRRNVYRLMESGKLPYFVISGHKFPAININP